MDDKMTKMDLTIVFIIVGPNLAKQIPNHAGQNIIDYNVYGYSKW